MKKYLILTGILGLSINLFAAWQMIGPPGGYMRSIVISPDNESVLFATSYSNPTKVFRSNDAGANWLQVGSYNSYNYCLAIAPGNILYAGYYGYVYKSTNGGVTWISSSVPSTYIYDLTVHPTNPSIIYGSGRHYVGSSTYALAFLKSTNGGTSWTILDLVSSGYSYGYAIACDPSNPNVIYCGGCGYDSTYLPKIFKSTDGGTSFTEVYSSTVGYYVYGLAVNPSNSNIVYAVTYYDGIYRSTDAGLSWTKVSSLNYNYRVKTSAANPDYVYCTGYTYFYKSTNAGLTWTSSATGLCGYSNYGLAVNPSNAAVVYMCNSAGVYKTTNYATNWYASSEGIKLGLPVVAATVAPSDPQRVFCQVDNIGVYKTTNSGTNWSMCPAFSSCGDMCALAIPYNNPNMIMAIEGLG